MIYSISVKRVKECWKTLYTQFMKAVDPEYEAKTIPQTHTCLGVLKEGLNARVNLRFAGLHWTAEVECDREKTQNLA